MVFNPTPEQALILQHDISRHARILAGPGTGKSATVVALIEKVLSAERPPRLKLLTFTCAATSELAQKIAEHPAAATQRPSTIHSFAMSVLLRNPGVGAFPKPLRLPDDWEQSQIVDPTLARLVGVKQVVLTRQLIPEMASGWEHLDEIRSLEVNAQLRARFVGAWHEHRRIYGYTVLAELPFRLREALRDHPDLRGVDYDLLIVDDYQDLNACDLEVLRLVAERGCRIIGTGDDDQSIHGFRGAAPEGIRRFPNDYAQSLDYPLSLTQRCGRRIVEWANYVIQGDPNRPHRRELRCADGAPEGTVALLSFENHDAEVRGIVDLIQHLIDRDGLKPSGILVLFRTDYHWQFSKLIRQELDQRDIPSFVPTVVDELMNSPSNRRLIEILRLLSNKTDSVAWASLLRLTPGIGMTFGDYIYGRARDADRRFGVTLLEAHGEGFPNANKAVAKRAADLVNGVLAWLGKRAVPDDQPEHGWGAWIIETAGGSVAPAPTRQFSELLLKLDEVVDDALDLDRYVSQIGPLGRDLMLTECDGVRIMQMATSKGLTVDATIIAAVGDGIIPRPGEDLSEEHRLMYVAMTRAKEHLYCTWARSKQGSAGRTRAGPGGLRQLTNFLLGGPVRSQDGARSLRN